MRSTNTFSLPFWNKTDNIIIMWRLGVKYSLNAFSYLLIYILYIYHNIHVHNLKLCFSDITPPRIRCNYVYVNMNPIQCKLNLFDTRFCGLTWNLINSNPFKYVNILSCVLCHLGQQKRNHYFTMSTQPSLSIAQHVKDASGILSIEAILRQYQSEGIKHYPEY